MLFYTSFINHNFNSHNRREICPIYIKTMIKLAQKLLSRICANLIGFIKNIIYSQDFIERNRQHSSQFTRDRKLSFPVLILYFCNLIKSSYQPELNKFWKILLGSEVARNVVSKAALCKARKKLKYEAFVELNSEAVKYFNTHSNPQMWKGFFLKAIDGSTIKLPNFTEICEHFGAWNPRLGRPRPYGPHIPDI